MEALESSESGSVERTEFILSYSEAGPEGYAQKVKRILPHKRAGTKEAGTREDFDLRGRIPPRDSILALFQFYPTR